jgi:carbon storage regulator
MLVFSRKKNDAIMVGKDVEITVIAIGRDFVKIGITAPRDITIHRKEVFEAIEQENREAGLSIQANRLSSIEALLKGAPDRFKPGSMPQARPHLPGQGTPSTKPQTADPIETSPQKKVRRVTTDRQKAVLKKLAEKQEGDA